MFVFQWLHRDRLQTLAIGKKEPCDDRSEEPEEQQERYDRVDLDPRDTGHNILIHIDSP